MSADPTKLRIGCTHKVLLKVEIKKYRLMAGISLT